jgi:UDP-glucose 4-epimerase
MNKITHSEPRKILISGANGYLGERLAQYLDQNGQLIVKSTRSNSDLFSVESLKKIVPEGGCIIHLAAADAALCKSDATLAHQINVKGTQNFLEAAKEKKINHFIYFSTIHVYGTPLAGELNENTNTSPQNTYAKTHLDAENLVKESGLNFTILRLSNALGCPLSPNGGAWKLLAHDLIKSSVVSNCLKLRSKGAQLRNFIPITELEKIIYYLIPNPQNTIVNVGSDVNLSVLELAKLIQLRIEQLNGKEIILEVGSDDEGDSLFHFNVNRLSSLGVNLEYDLIPEIDRIIKFVK